MEQTCFVCGSPCDQTPTESVVQVDCLRCGEYCINDESLSLLQTYRTKIGDTQIANISGWIREHQTELVTANILTAQILATSPSVGEKAEKLLKWVASQLPIAGHRFAFNSENCAAVLEIGHGSRFEDRYPNRATFLEVAKGALPLMGASWAISAQELHYILSDYLCGAGYLQISDTRGYCISPAGWEYLYQLKSQRTNSEAAFVAMWFSAETDKLWTEGIEPAIRAAGYKPVRIDTVQHNNRIDDEIIANIRKSKFVVADFTGQRGGVYFEAGFALGLGLQVIWLCKKPECDEHKIHFDTRQYNFLLWDTEKLEALKTALVNRIEATIGHGTYAA